MELRLISLPNLNTHVKIHVVPGSTVRHSHRSVAVQVVGLGNDGSFIKFPLTRLEQHRHTKSKRWNRICLATDVGKVISESSDLNSNNGVDGATDGNQLTSSTMKPLVSDAEKSSNSQDTPKRSPLTAREKLRAARVLSKYTQSKPSKSEAGSKVLEALRESDQKNKKKAGLPEAPSNLFDDRKRGMPKQGLTFNFPGGNDLLIIAFSFIFISTVMFATTYFVWKVGAIHFNEY